MTGNHITPRADMIVGDDRDGYPVTAYVECGTILEHDDEMIWVEDCYTGHTMYAYVEGVDTAPTSH